MAIFNSYVSLPEGNFRICPAWCFETFNIYDCLQPCRKKHRTWDGLNIVPQQFSPLILLILPIANIRGNVPHGDFAKARAGILCGQESDQTLGRSGECRQTVVAWSSHRNNRLIYKKRWNNIMFNGYIGKSTFSTAMLFYQRVWEILIMRYHGMYPLEILRLANWTITILVGLL